MGESGLNGDEEDNSKAAVFVRFFFLYSSADKGPSPCLTRNTMRKRRLPPTPLRREMEISSRPAKRPRRASWTSSSVSTSTNGGSRGPRRRKRPRGRKSGLSKRRSWPNRRRKRRSDCAKRRLTRRPRKPRRKGSAWKRPRRRGKP